MGLFKCAVGAREKKTVKSLWQVRIGDCLQTGGGVEPRGHLEGNRLIVDKSVHVRGADALLIKAHGIDVAAFYSCDFRAHKSRPVFEIRRGMLRPYFELSLMSRQGLEMLLPFQALTTHHRNLEIWAERSEN